MASPYRSAIPLSRVFYDNTPLMHSHSVPLYAAAQASRTQRIAEHVTNSRLAGEGVGAGSSRWGEVMFNNLFSKVAIK
eukprot:scaffold25906_cov86-Skeletonema_dohrnii-CCMP3373.AAC.2